MPENSPLVAAALHTLLERVRSGEFAVGRGLPSERQLAEDLSVSRVVVRAAIQELERMGFVACKARCRPVVCAPRSTNRVAGETAVQYISVWLWPSAGDFCAASILRGIQSVALPSGLKITVASAVGDDLATRLESEAQFLQSLAQDAQVAGAIIWYLGGEKNLDALRAAQSAGVPLVFLDRLPPASIQADFVGTDNAGAARRAVAYFTSLGHRKIALLSNIDKVSSVLAREEGYRKALQESRIAHRPEYVFEVQTDGIESVAEAVRKMLQLPDPPTAIFGINDHVALQAHEALTNLGVSVPTEISVMGFDGLLRWVPGGGYLTSAWQDFDRIGQTATELILEKMDTAQDHNFKHILFDAPVRPRASSARLLPTRPEKPNHPRDFTEEVLS